MSTELSQFDELKTNVTAFVAPTFAVKVTNFETCQQAVSAAQQVKGFLKQLDSKRKDLVGPLNDRVDAINGRAKEIKEPLMNAELHLKREIAKFEEQQEKIREAERHKAEQERLAKEAKAREEAEKAAAELRARQESERAREKAAESIFGSDDEESPEVESLEAKQAREAAELQARIDEKTAQLASEARQREWDIKQQGTKGIKKLWRCEVIDIAKVPREFLKIELNEAAVLAMARAGSTEIPGVRIWQETSVSIGAKTYVPRVAIEKEKAGA
jgi:chromosome segregation ATPase